MRKILAATAIALSLATPVQAQYFWGSGPGGGMGGGWNACSNCGMRMLGPGGGYFNQLAGGTNGFGAGQRGWFGVPSANGYGGGYLGNMGMGMLGGMFGGGGMGMGGLGMLGGLFGGGGGFLGSPNGAAYGTGEPGYAYRAVRRGGYGAMPQMQYRQGGGYVNNPGPGYETAPGAYYGAGPNVRRVQYVPQVQYITEPRRQICKLINTGYGYTKVCY